MASLSPPILSIKPSLSASSPEYTRPPASFSSSSFRRSPLPSVIRFLNVSPNVERRMREKKVEMTRKNYKYLVGTLEVEDNTLLYHKGP